MILDKKIIDYPIDIVKECIESIPFEKLSWKGCILDNHDVFDASGVNDSTKKCIPFILQTIISDVNKKYPETKDLGVWVNHYRNKDDFINWHQDSLTKKKNIYILSLGSSRPLLIKNNKKDDIQCYILEHCDMFIMSNEENETNKHMVPKMGYEVDDRISIVFS